MTAKIIRKIKFVTTTIDQDSERVKCYNMFLVRHTI